MKMDMNPRDRAVQKRYAITVNGDTFSVNSSSLGQAIRQAADIRLDDEDVVTVQVEE